MTFVCQLSLFQTLDDREVEGIKKENLLKQHKCRVMSKNFPFVLIYFRVVKLRALEVRGNGIFMGGRMYSYLFKNTLANDIENDKGWKHLFVHFFVA